MSVTVAQVITSVGRLLQDIDHTRWEADALIDYINEAQTAIVAVKPDANPVTSVVQLVSGTKQSLPADAISLLNITRNMGANGTAPGEAITRTSMVALSSLLPSWHTIESGIVQKFISEADNKNIFYVFPAQPSTTTYVEIIYSKRPAALTASTDNIELDDEYKSVIINYVVFKCFSEEIDSPDSQNKAQTYFALFEKAIGAKITAETAAEA